MERWSKKRKIAACLMIYSDLAPVLLSGLNIAQHLASPPNLNVRYVALLGQSPRQTHYRIPDFYEKSIDCYLAQDYYMHFRMTRETSGILLSELGHICSTKSYRGGHLPVPLEKALLMTLWYLGKGESLLSTGDRFNVSTSRTHHIVHEIVRSICLLKEKYIVWPTERECMTISSQFYLRNRYPGVIGAIDGCHITCKIPQEQHDSYQDRKFNHSITMQGTCTASRIFTNVSVGYPGSIHDARILTESTLGRAMAEGQERNYFYNNYHLLGDSAYPCKSWLITPYRDTGSLTAQQRRHNYAHSATRVVIENVFGLLKSRWRVLQYVNVYSVSKAVHIITACCVLHNFCLINHDDFDIETTDIEDTGSEAYGLQNDIDGIQKRNDICSYF